MHAEITARDQLLIRIAGMPEATVTIIGDIMLDKFIYGDVERISPESPVPILSIRRECQMLGGAGNVLSNLAGLGVSAMLVTITGEDTEADIVSELVRDFSASENGIIRDPERPTTIKTRYLAGHQHLLRTDYEKAGPPSTAIENAIIEKVRESINGSDAVVLSDYGKGVLTTRVIRSAIDLAHQKGIPCLVDPKGRDFSRYEGADVITPNLKELSLAAGNITVKGDEQITEAARKIMEECGLAAVVATRSQEGMSILRKKSGQQDFEEPVHLSANAREVFDVSGAGDTVIATIAAALASGADLVEAATLANIAGGIVVGKAGTAPIRAEELKDAITTRAEPPTEKRQAQLCSHEQAAQQARRWQAEGLRVGFTNGCFDLLHAGHVRYLNSARSKCDRLILGLNCDASVRRLKGPERPVNNEQDRAEVTGALGCIDMVVLFGAEEDEKDMPVKIIGEIRPDIHFKGGDYRLEDLPEARVVLSYGGKVELLELVPGRSTTAILQRSKQ